MNMIMIIIVLYHFNLKMLHFNKSFVPYILYKRQLALQQQRQSLAVQLHSEWTAPTYTRRRSEHKLWIQTHTHTDRRTDRRANITCERWLPRTAEATCRICCCCCTAYSAANSVNHSSL